MAKAKVAKRQLLKQIEGLSEERIKVLVDLAAFLREREEWEETMEILADKELSEAIEASRRAWREGKKEEFVPFHPMKVNDR